MWNSDSWFKYYMGIWCACVRKYMCWTRSTWQMDQRGISISHSHSIKNIFSTHTHNNLNERANHTFWYFLFLKTFIKISFYFGLLSYFGSPKHWCWKPFIIHKQKLNVSDGWMIKKCYCKNVNAIPMIERNCWRKLSSWKFSPSKSIQVFYKNMLCYYVWIAHEKNGCQYSSKLDGICNKMTKMTAWLFTK